MCRKLIIVLILLPAFCLAAFEVQSINTSSIALGSITSLYPGSLNPAFPARQKSLFMRADYARLYGLSGLDYYQVQMGWNPNTKNCIGLYLRNLGNPVYQEKTVGISYGQSLRDILSLGLSVHLYNIAIAGYQSSTAIGLTLGSVWNLNEQMQIAVLFQNINSPSIYECSDPLPECFSLGARYIPLSKIELCGELFKDTEFPFSLRVGAIIKLFDFMDLKFGTQLNPDRYSGGISMYWKKLSLDFAFQHHQILPYTLYYGIGYGLK
ncbi:MAG: hypothetical protein Q7J65_09540 [Candidatus Marinimicrobia bacterium]|nr:hypothetical protein [Candidatus Neomarinimicrobiota bacterium]